MSTKALRDAREVPQLTRPYLAKMQEEMVALQMFLQESSRMYAMQTNFTRQATFQVQSAHAANEAAAPQMVPGPGRKTSSRNAASEPPPRPSSTRSERSVRSNDCIASQESENPRDIWVISAPMFREPPTEEEFREVCKMRLLDSEGEADSRPKPHWSEILGQIASNTQRDHSDKVIQRPPGPHPTGSDVSEYWKTHNAPFPMEDMQRQHSSVMHRLLNAFVEAKPLPKSTETQTRDVMPVHVLLPKIELHEYLNYSFDERLEMELESAGLGKLPQDADMQRGPFADDIAEYEAKLKEIQELIDQIQNEVIPELPKMHADHQRRLAEQREYAAIMSQIKPDPKRNRK